MKKQEDQKEEPNNKYSPDEVTKFSEGYYEVLDEINENNSENAKDQNSDYMDELREESDNIRT